jgi:hypothetical protein
LNPSASSFGTNFLAVEARPAPAPTPHRADDWGMPIISGIGHTTTMDEMEDKPMGKAELLQWATMMSSRKCVKEDDLKAQPALFLDDAHFILEHVPSSRRTLLPPWRRLGAFPVAALSLRDCSCLRTVW